jgi:hypothetical protein
MLSPNIKRFCISFAFLPPFLALSCIPETTTTQIPTAEHLPLNKTPVNTPADATGGFWELHPPTTIVLTQADQAAIYATVIRQIYTKDDSFGGKLQPPELYIKDYTDDKAGNLLAPESYSTLIPAEVQSSVLAALADLPVKLIWKVKYDRSWPDITLGNIYVQQDGSVQVAGSIYVANNAARGQTYILQRSGASWSITGTTGVMWVS